MGYDVRDIWSTPNPDAKKFVLDREISSVPISFRSAEAATGHPLATQLFEIKGVTAILLVNDFVTVNKVPGMRWDKITAKVREILKKTEFPTR